MRLLTTLSFGLICTSAIAQVTPVGATPPPANVAGVQAGPLFAVSPAPGPAVTQHARVRAFNAGPDGQVRSMYLSNGTVVDLSGFGPGVGSQIHKRSHVRYTGTRTVINGQAIVAPQQLSIGQQTFTANSLPSQGPGGQPGELPPQGFVAGVGPGAPGMPPAPPVGRPGVPTPPPGGGAPPPPPAPARRGGSAQPGVAPPPAATTPAGTTAPAPLPPTGQGAPHPSRSSTPPGSAITPPPSSTLN